MTTDEIMSTDASEVDMSDEMVATQAGQEALAKIHAIEREMLSRAIYVLADMSGKTAEQVIANLSINLDEEYEEAAGNAEASSKLTRGMKPKQLIIPGGAL